MVGRAFKKIAFKKHLFFNSMYIKVLSECVSVCAPCGVPGAWGQKRALDTLGLESKRVVAVMPSLQPPKNILITLFSCVIQDSVTC